MLSEEAVEAAIKATEKWPKEWDCTVNWFACTTPPGFDEYEIWTGSAASG